MTEDKASWLSFFQWLKGRRLNGAKLIVGDKCLGMLEAAGEVFPEAKYQRCTVHFYRNVLHWKRCRITLRSPVDWLHIRSLLTFLRKTIDSTKFSMIWSKSRAYNGMMA